MINSWFVACVWISCTVHTASICRPSYITYCPQWWFQIQLLQLCRIYSDIILTLFLVVNLYYSEVEWHWIIVRIILYLTYRRHRRGGNFWWPTFTRKLCGCEISEREMDGDDGWKTKLNHLSSNQLEKLEAAKAAWLVCLSLLSLPGSFLVLLGFTWSFWVLLGEFLLTLLGLT